MSDKPVFENNNQPSLQSAGMDQLHAEQLRKQAFLDEYMALTRRHGYEITARPTWIGTNHSSFEMSIIVEVNRIRSE